jgi:K+-sensing histidine kinase KdpD
MTMTWTKTRRRPVLRIGAAVAPLAACSLLAVVRDSVTQATAALVLVLIVVAVAATGDRVAGMVAAVSSGVWFDFFLTQPYGTFVITDSNDVEVVVLLVLVGSAVAELALWGLRQQSRASRRSGYLDGVLRAAAIATERQNSPQALIGLVTDEIVDVLGVDAGRFVPGAPITSRAAVLEQSGLVSRHGRMLDVERDGLPTDGEIALLVSHGGASVGQFMLTASTRVVRPSIEQRKVAVLLADQVATAHAAHGR